MSTVFSQCFCSHYSSGKSVNRPTENLFSLVVFKSFLTYVCISFPQYLLLWFVLNDFRVLYVQTHLPLKQYILGQMLSMIWMVSIYSYVWFSILFVISVKSIVNTSELNPTVYPTKYSDNIRFENGTFVLPHSFANFSGYAEESDFTVTVIMQVQFYWEVGVLVLFNLWEL